MCVKCRCVYDSAVLIRDKLFCLNCYNTSIDQLLDVVRRGIGWPATEMAPEPTRRSVSTRCVDGAVEWSCPSCGSQCIPGMTDQSWVCTRCHESCYGPNAERAPAPRLCAICQQSTLTGEVVTGGVRFCPTCYATAHAAFMMTPERTHKGQPIPIGDPCHKCKDPSRPTVYIVGRRLCRECMEAGLRATAAGMVSDV